MRRRAHTLGPVTESRLRPIKWREPYSRTLARRRIAIDWGLGLLFFGTIIWGAGVFTFEKLGLGTQPANSQPVVVAATIALCLPVIVGGALCLASILRTRVAVSDRFIEWTCGKAILHLTRGEIEDITINQADGRAEMTVTYKRLTFFPRPWPPKARTITLGVHRRVHIPSLNQRVSAILAARRGS